MTGSATVDRTDYQWSKLTDGTSSSNDDRNFTQYGGVGRVSYELNPAVKPFIEVQGDSIGEPVLANANASMTITVV